MSIGKLILDLFVAGAPALLEAIQQAVANAGKDDADDARKRPLTVSVSWGGGEGKAVAKLREIEEKLPDDFDPNA